MLKRICKSVVLGGTLVVSWPFLLSPPAEAHIWTQTDWSGGPGQLTWSDSTMYYTGTRVDGWRSPGDLKLDAPDDSNWVNTGDLAGATSVPSVIEASDGTIYAGTGFFEGDVFKSTDGGANWSNTGELTATSTVHSLIEASDGALYAGTRSFGDTGRVFKSIDGGVNWTITGDLVGAWSVLSVMEASDGALYAGTYPYAYVFKSTNGGVSWDTTRCYWASRVHSLIEASSGALYAGTELDGDVFKSTNAGTTWVNTGELAGAQRVFSLLEASDGALYAGTDSNGDVFKSVDGGTTWVSTGAPWAWFFLSVIETSGSVIYAGTGPNADVFKSANAGTTWVNTGELAGAENVWSLLEASDGALYAGTDPNGDVFKAHYFLSGDLVSSVYHAENASVTYGIMTWAETLNNQTIVMKVRTDTLPDMATAPDWGVCPPVVNGQDISSLSSVDDGERYAQYRVESSTSHPDTTPCLHEVTIEYEVGVEESPNSQLRASNYQLQQNYPNPFSKETHIAYSIWSLAQTGDAMSHKPLATSLSIYDLSGRLMKTLVGEQTQAGAYNTKWDGMDDRGKQVPAGIYLYRLVVDDRVLSEPEVPALTGAEVPAPSSGEVFTATKKLVLLR